MAELFLARTLGPEGFEKLVVLKKILPSYAENPKFVRLFLDEAKLAATLDHPHIAHVYDMGKVEGHYFFTMEYVHGQDVRTTLRRTARLNQKFPIDHAVQIARNVAAALHYAHERRRPDGSLLDIVHRDVSPSNVLVSYDGAVKLVDFGVAKAATSTVKTRTGALKGKISYMSPEQAKGSPIDRRSDIFSLGIVLWEMVTTQRLFKTDNDLATIQMIINSRPQAPSQLRPECSPELERIVMRALASDLEERYQTAEQLQLDLEELAREQKLKQSSVSLRTWMHDLFAEEIRAWSMAQASGQTLTEHLERAEMTTPVSESELDLDYYEDLEDDNESEQVPTTLGPPGTQQIAVPPPPRVEPPPVAGDVIPISSANAVTVIDGKPLGEDHNVTVDLHAPRHTPFPVAPLEWRPNIEEAAHLVDANEQRTKRIIIGASVAFGAFVLIVMALTGAAKAPAKVEATPEPPSARVEMKSQPPQQPPAPAVEPPQEEQPAPVVEEEEPKPKRKSKPKSRTEAKAADKTKDETKVAPPPPPPPRKWDPNGVEEPH